MSLLDFKELKETWGSGYIITEGKYKGYVLETKTIVERICPLGEEDDGLPKFKVSHHTVVRVLPPEVVK